MRSRRSSGLDPAEVRRVNLLKPPTVTVNGLRVLSYGLPECIDQVVTRSGWNERRDKMPRGRGLGIACSHYVSGAANSIIRSDMPHSTVNIKIDRDGGVVVYTGASEIGQGSDTMTAQVVAEVLGCSLSRVKVIAADTDLTPIDLGSYSSRVTFMAGNAALRAAQDVKKNIVSAAAKRMNCSPEEVIMRDDHVWRAGTTASDNDPTASELLEQIDAPRGRVDGQILRGSVLQTRKEEGPKQHMSFEEAVVSAIDFHGALTGTGSYAPPMEARGGKHKGGGVGPSPAYSYSAQVAEVSVDEETGEVTVHKVWAAHDCGRALNPVAVEGQVVGSVWMGLGQALQEEMVWKDGLMMNPGLLEYRSPSSVESPEIETIIVESIDPEGPFGAKEAGEGSLAATIPAISNAIYHAVGVRLREAPFTPERVLAALRAKRGDKKIEMTESVDPTAPTTFREHGGSLWFNGKGPMRHPLDPARHKASANVGGRAMSLPSFQLLRPRTLDETMGFLAKHAGDTKIVAGGTDLLPSMKQKLFTPPYVLDLRGVAELQGDQTGRWRWHQHRRAHAAQRNRAFAAHSTRLSRAVRSGEDGRLAGDSQHGDAGRQYLPRHALPVVQPVAAVAQELRFLPEERWRSLPRRSRRQVLLGDVLR